MGGHHPRFIPQAPVTRESSASPEVLTEAAVALNIAARRQELHHINAAAVTLAARCYFGLHEAASTATWCDIQLPSVATISTWSMDKCAQWVRDAMGKVAA